MYTLATLYALRQQLGLADDDTDEDARLLMSVEAASAALERRTGRRFVPRLAILKHRVDLRNTVALLLRDDLLELQAITNGDGSSIALSDVVQLSGSLLRLINGAFFTYEEVWEDAFQVTGIWGYHPCPDEAWLDSEDTVQDSPLSASATTLTVTDADAGDPPRFQVGQLLRIEEEYLWLRSINTSTNVLTVDHGVQGTTAATHASGTAIEIYQVPQDIALVTLNRALWLYREPDAPSSEMPPFLLDALEGLRRITVKA